MPFDFTYFAPTGNPDTDANARQINPTGHYTADTLDDIREFVGATTLVKHKGGAGYIIAGDCQGTRSAKNTGPASFALIDWDDSPPDWEQLNQYEGFGWTTHNHTEAEPHWRFVIPFEQPVLHGKLPDPWPGAHIRNRAQPAFLPTGASVRVVELNGSKRLTAVAEVVTAVHSKVESTLLYTMFKRAGWVIGEGPNDGVWVRCPWAHEHTDQDESGTGVLPDDSGLGLFTCRHGHCANRHSGDAYAVLEALPCNAKVSTTPKAKAESEPPSASARAIKPSSNIADWADIMGAPIPPIEWICQDLRLAPGRPSVIYSQPNAGKSWSIQTLAVEIAAGLPVFGRFPCAQAPVMFVTQDSDHTASAERFQQISRSLQVGQIPLFWYTKRLPIVRRDGKFGAFDPEGFAELYREIEARGVRVLILDSIFALTEGLDAKELELGRLMRYTNHPSVATIWTHHTGKAEGSDYYGSQAIATASGMMWEVRLSTEGDDASPRLWTPRRKPERMGDLGKPEDFLTEWRDYRRIAWCEARRETENGPMAETLQTRIQREIIAVLRERALRQSTLIGSGKAEQSGAVKTGSRALRRKVLDSMTGLTVILLSDNKYTLAPGV